MRKFLCYFFFQKVQVFRITKFTCINRTSVLLYYVYNVKVGAGDLEQR